MGAGAAGRPVGITSACAEQTDLRQRGHQRHKDHLRVCGADDRAATPTVTASGSPPRVRSRHALKVKDLRKLGITSACAEQTESRVDRLDMKGDHLRVCGADKMAKIIPVSNEGSPPRVRSRPTRLDW